MISNKQFVKIKSDCVIEDNSIVGYFPSRKIDKLELIIGDNSVIRANTIIYLGSTIGSYFETGHNVVVREECNIGNKCL